MDSSPHALLFGTEEFAAKQGVTFVTPDYFVTERQSDALRKALAAESNPSVLMSGTVGAVACGPRGNLAAASSTGGMTNKRNGRVGDTPLMASVAMAE